MNTESPSSTPQAYSKAGANLGLVHVLKAVPLVTESPSIGERTVHHLEAGSIDLNYPNKDIQRPSKMRLVWC